MPIQKQSRTQSNEPTPHLGSARDDLTIESRLCSIERTLERLASLVENAVVRGATEKESKVDAQIPPRTHECSNKSDARAPELFIGDSHSFSLVKEATANIRTTPGIPGPPYQQEPDAQSELQFLSTSLTTAAVELGHNSPMTGFYVPSKALGYKLIGSKWIGL